MGENGVPKNAGFTNGIPNETLSSNLPPLYNHCIDDYRPIKVICIGAGLSGILAGIRFPQRIKNLDFTIYDKNHDVGGTWLENRWVMNTFYGRTHKNYCGFLTD
jgi:ribulose 1,5-bisphosphate synthetase/thiazole synthase